MIKITYVEKGSRAFKAGVQSGDELVCINENEICDVLDYRFYLAERLVNLSLLRDGGAFSLSLIKKKRVRSDGERLYIEDDRREKTTDTGYEIELSLGENILPCGGRIYMCRDKRELDEIKTQNVYKLFIQQPISFDTINSTWYARSRRTGDKMISGGHTG